MCCSLFKWWGLEEGGDIEELSVINGGRPGCHGKICVQGLNSIQLSDIVVELGFFKTSYRNDFNI